MLERARGHAEFLGAEVTHVVHVPGAFDRPLAAKRLLKRKDVDGVGLLGAVIKGDTKHDELIAGAAAKAAGDVAHQTDKPVALGPSGPGRGRVQAIDRIASAES